MKKYIPIFLIAITSGCMSIPNYESYYYDQWYGEFHSEIRYTRSDEVYQFRIGYDRPRKGRIQGYKLPADEIPVFPDFIHMEIDGSVFQLNELTPEMFSKVAFLGPRKTGFFQYGDSVEFHSKSVMVEFFEGKPVYFYCTGGNVIFRNIKTGEYGNLPMSVRKMKSIFGEPTRAKKDVVL